MTSQQRRLFCARIGEATTEAVLDDVAEQHRRVLRLKDGQEVELFDGKGTMARAVLGRASARVLSVSTASEPFPRLGLIVCMPKPKTADDVVRFATELGAAELVLVWSERSVSPSKKGERLDRWHRIAREACRQSERAFLPQLRIEEDLTWATSQLASGASRYVCHARGTEDTTVQGENRWVVVGPEGGLTPSELDGLKAAEFAPLSLGRHILRVDTAVCAAMTLLAR